MKYKINKQLLNKEPGFNWTIRYSDTHETDDCGRWARICYYNGLYIAWINGYVYQDEYPNLDNGRTGIVNKFTVSLGFPVSTQQHGGTEKFDTIKDAMLYVEEMFIDFKKIINKRA